MNSVTDYSESIISLKQYIKSIEERLNKAQFAIAYEISLEIQAEAIQLKQTIQAMLLDRKKNEANQ